MLFTSDSFLSSTSLQGAATTCYVALHPEVRGISGEYFADNKIAKANSLGRDIDLAKKLWDFSMNLIKVEYLVPIVDADGILRE